MKGEWVEIQGGRAKRTRGKEAAKNKNPSRGHLGGGKNPIGERHSTGEKGWGNGPRGTVQGTSRKTTMGTRGGSRFPGGEGTGDGRKVEGEECKLHGFRNVCGPLWSASTTLQGMPLDTDAI